MSIVTGNALGFFNGSGIVFPFLVDLSDSCRNFRLGIEKIVGISRISNVIRLGIVQQCNMTRYTSAIFEDWQYPSNVIRQGIRQNCFKVGNSSAM